MTTSCDPNHGHLPPLVLEVISAIFLVTSTVPYQFSVLTPRGQSALPFICPKVSLTVAAVVQLLSRVQLFATPWTAAHQAFLSITISRSLLKLISIESVMPSNNPSSVIPFFSCLQSFPASGSFLMNQLFTSGGQSIGASASASVLPMNIQD